VLSAIHRVNLDTLSEIGRLSNTFNYYFPTINFEPVLSFRVEAFFVLI
jgi:hypothetical protein